MKRILYVFASLILAVLICSCGGIETENEKEFSPAPKVIYSTTAEENGYADKQMFVDGTIGKEFEQKGIKICEVETEDGTIALMSIPILTPSKEWSKLKEGELVRVYFQYLGYSDVLNEASGALLSVGKASAKPPSNLEDVYVDGTPVSDPAPEEDNGIWAKQFTPINDFRYTLDKKQKTITLDKYKGNDTKIMLSPVYRIGGEDYSLISTGDGACFLSETHITSIYIPEGVTYISDNCFNSCSNLKYLYIPSTVKTLGKSFFDYLHEYTAYCDSVSVLPSDRDTTDYVEVENETDSAYELGESLADAVNGIVGGINSDPDNPVITEIYYGGSENQWYSIIEN